MVTSTEGGQQNFQGLMPDGTLIPINLTMQDGKAVAGELLPPIEEISKTPATDSNIDSIVSFKIKSISDVLGAACTIDFLLLKSLVG